MKVKMNLQEIAYFCFFGMLLIVKGIGLYEGMPLFNVGLLLAIFFLGCKILLTDYTLREWAILFLFTFVSFVAYQKTGEKAVIVTVLTILAIKNISINRLLKFAFIIWTITFYGMFLFHIADITDPVILAHNKFGLGFLLRYSMGFPHPNVFHISYFIWMALLLYLFPMKNRKLWVASFLLFGMNLFVFLYSVSITGFALVTIYLIFNLYLSKREKLNIIEKILIQCVYPACVLVSVIPPLFFKGKLYDILNKILNTRMNIWNYYLTNFKPGPFGTKVWSPADAVLSMDCSYLYLLYYYGLYLFLAISLLFIYTIWRYTKENKKAELAIIIGMLIAGITEPYLFNLSFKNLILIFAGNVFYRMLGENDKKSVKKLQILPWGEKEVTIFAIKKDPIKGYWEAFRQKLCIMKKWVLLIGVIAGGLGLMIALLCVRVPDRIYVYTEHCDYVGGDGTTLQEVQQEAGAEIYGVRSEQLTYYGFEGNILRLEKIRLTVSIVLGMVILSEIFFCVVLCYNQCRLTKGDSRCRNS